MKRIIVSPALILYLTYLISLSVFVGCGGSEDTESSDSLVIPSELYDTSQLSYDINEVEVLELIQLDIPENWDQTEDLELRAQYHHAHLLKQFGNIPAVHIVASHERKKQLETPYTFDEQIDYVKAQHLLWPTESNLLHLETFLRIKWRRKTDDPELFAKLYRAELSPQYGDIPELDIVVEGERKLWFGGFTFPGDEDKYITFLEAKYVLWPSETVLHTIRKYRQAKAEGTPFHLIDWDDNDE